MQLTEQMMDAAATEYNSLLQVGKQLSERSIEDGGWAEYLSEGELAIEDGVKQAHCAIMLENARRWLGGLHESTRSTMVGGFQDYLFPIIRASFAENPIYDLVSVQPMTRKVGQIFWLNYIYGSNKGQFKRGDRIYDTESGWTGATGYTDEVVEGEELVATSAATTYTANLDYSPVRPGTVEITIDDTTDYVLRDNGNGELTKISGGALTISSSSVDYNTGAVSVTFNSALAGSQAVVCTYAFDGEGSNNIPEVDFELASSAVTAKRRAVKLKYNEETQQDFGAEFGMDASSIIVNGCTQTMIGEVAGEVVKDLWSLAGPAVADFDVTQTAQADQGYSRTEHLRDLRFQLNTASNSIYDKTQRAEGNFIICDMNAATILETMGRPVFEPVAQRTTNRQGLVRIGRLDGKYDVYRYKHLASFPGAAAFGNMMMGYKGPDFWDAGYVYAPYQSLYMSARDARADFTTRQAFATRYAKKKVNNNMYTRITLSQS